MKRLFSVSRIVGILLVTSNAALASMARGDSCTFQTLSDTIVGTEQGDGCTLNGVQGVLQNDTHAVVELNSCTGQTQSVNYTSSTCVYGTPAPTPDQVAHDSCVQSCSGGNSTEYGYCDNICSENGDHICPASPGC